MSTNPKLILSQEDMTDAGQRVMNMAIDHFLNLKDRPVTEPTDPEVLKNWLLEPIPERGIPFDDVLDEFEDKALNTLTHTDHPRCFAFVPGPSNFVSAMAETLAASFNVFAGAWLGPSGIAAIELKSIAWLKSLYDLPKTSGGLFVSGGSMANLTALAVARHVKLDNNLANGTIYFSDQTHSSVTKALKILGFQPHQIRSIESDENHRLSLQALAAKVEEDRRRGLVPFCVVANAGTTNSAAIDPLGALADYCKTQGLWFHVDGAYGGAAAISPRGKALLKGIDKADSITIDPHKWMFQPYEIGCLLVRDTAHLREAFRITAEYLDILGDSYEQLNYCDHGVQLTRGFRALKFWMSLKTFGLENFRAAIDVGIDNADYVQTLLEGHPNWEVVTRASIGVINFRYVSNTTLPDNFHSQISRELLVDGFAMVTTTRINDVEVFRLCTINPRTTHEDLEMTLDKLMSMAQSKDV